MFLNNTSTIFKEHFMNYFEILNQIDREQEKLRNELKEVIKYESVKIWPKMKKANNVRTTVENCQEEKRIQN